MQLDNMEDVKKTITEFKSIFTNIYDVKKDIEDQLAIKDDETIDYLHELELGDLNAIDLMKKEKNRKKKEEEFNHKMEENSKEINQDQERT